RERPSLAGPYTLGVTIFQISQLYPSRTTQGRPHVARERAYVRGAFKLDKRVIYPPRRVLRARLNRSEAVGSRRDLTRRRRLRQRKGGDPLHRSCGGSVRDLGITNMSGMFVDR